MRILLRDASDQTLIAIEADVACYQPDATEIFFLSGSGSYFSIGPIEGESTAASIIQELAVKGHCDLTNYEATWK